jgi:hypothetical protein
MSWPLIQGYQYDTLGVSTVTSRGTLVTAGTPASTKGSYSEIVAATTFAAQGIWVVINRGSASAAVLVDIAVGAAASEQVIISDIYVRPRGSGLFNSCPLYLPLAIPEGSRISARSQSSTAATTVDVSVILVRGGRGFCPVSSNVFPIGSAGANSPGLSSGVVSANTKISYVEMTSSLARDINYLVVGLHSVCSATCGNLYDIAIGGSGSEQIIMANMPDGSHSSIQVNRYSLIPCRLPAGTRIAMRGQSSSTLTTLVGSLHGV